VGYLVDLLVTLHGHLLPESVPQALQCACCKCSYAPVPPPLSGGA
jgi:hypothetical protein